MTVRLTPTLGLKGVYQVQSPYSVQAGVTYTCTALRSFMDLSERGVDVFARYYEAHGVSHQDYETDRDAGATIVTLASNEGVVELPDSYIQTLPGQITDPVSLLVLSVDLGPLPDALGLTHLTQSIGNYCSEVVGYTPEIKLHRIEHTDTLTQTELDNIDTARTAAVEIQQDTWSLLQDEKAKTVRLEARLQRMEQLLIDNGVLTPAP